MLDALTPEILQYCEKHTSPDSAECRALARETREKTTGSSMLTGPVEGTLLTLLARATGAKNVLEIGTFTGYSALKFAEGLPPDGRVITCDVDSETSKIARRFWAESPHGKKITQLMGPAVDTLQQLPGPFDIVFIDADKESGIEYWEACVPKLRRGGLILVDNVLWSGRVLNPQEKDGAAMNAFNAHAARDARVDLVMLTVRDGITMACKR